MLVQLGSTISRRNRVVEVNLLPSANGMSSPNKGTITCEHVVDAAGCYADQVALLSGFRVPQANILHHYLVTEEIPELVEHGVEMPVMRDNRVAGYIRQEQTAGLIGIYEHRGAEQIWADGVPWEAENPLVPGRLRQDCPLARRSVRPRADHGRGRHQECDSRRNHPHDRLTHVAGASAGREELLAQHRFIDRPGMGPWGGPRTCPLDGARRDRTQPAPL